MIIQGHWERWMKCCPTHVSFSHLPTRGGPEAKAIRAVSNPVRRGGKHPGAFPFRGHFPNSFAGCNLCANNGTRRKISTFRALMILAGLFNCRAMIGTVTVKK